MVDTISNAKGIRHSGSATNRYGAPSSSTSTGRVTPVVSPAAADSDRREAGEQGARDERHPAHSAEPQGSDLRLEIGEDSNGAELIYRFVDAQTGAIVREWPAGEFGKLRDYMRDKKIHLLDKKV